MYCENDNVSSHDCDFSQMLLFDKRTYGISKESRLVIFVLRMMHLRSKYSEN